MSDETNRIETLLNDWGLDTLLATIADAAIAKRDRALQHLHHSDPTADYWNEAAYSIMRLVDKLPPRIYNDV